MASCVNYHASTYTFCALKDIHEPSVAGRLLKKILFEFLCSRWWWEWETNRIHGETARQAVRQVNIALLLDVNYPSIWVPGAKPHVIRTHGALLTN